MDKVCCLLTLLVLVTDTGAVTAGWNSRDPGAHVGDPTILSVFIKRFLAFWARRRHLLACVVVNVSRDSISSNLIFGTRLQRDVKDAINMDRTEPTKSPRTSFLGGLTPPRLLDVSELPAWYAQNNFVRRGFRPVTNSVELCIHSLGYIHNETVNIYSHLLPAVIAFLGNVSFDAYFSLHYPLASRTDRTIFQIFITSSLLCFGISATYHTLLCHSHRYANFWVRADYVGIIIQILGSFISGIYMGFYCEPHLQRLHWSIIGGLSVLTGLIVISPKPDSTEWRRIRLSAFVATGFSAFAPIIHAATLFPYDQLDKQAGLRFYYAEGVAILLGVFFYATHFPEVRHPLRFDLFGASHQIFHLFVVIGAATHLHGILDAYDWNYRNRRCALH